MIITSKSTQLASIKKSSHNNRGFTLLELLIAIAIFGIVVGLIIDEYSAQTGQSITQQQAVEIQQTARASMYLISNKLKMAGFDPQGNNDAGITAAGDGINGSLDFSYYVDFGEDGINNNPPDTSIDEAGEWGTGFTLQTLSYAFNDSDGDGDNDIEMNDNSGGYNLLAENISTLDFTYFDQDNNSITIPIPPATLEDIRTIQITITATTDSNERDQSNGNNLRTITTIVKCRNLGL